MTSEKAQILNSQNWKSIMEKLYAHSMYRVGYFGLNSELRMKGKQAIDFANEAVILLYSGTRNWDMTKHPDLLEYLKNVVNSLIWSLVKSKERKSLSELDISIEINDEVFFDRMFDNTFTSNDLKSEIQKELSNDPLMLTIFNSLSKGFTPKEIEEELMVDIKEIRNAQKRLRRLIRREFMIEI